MFIFKYIMVTLNLLPSTSESPNWTPGPRLNTAPVMGSE